MKKYQIVESAGNQNHAGSKATADIAKIAKKMGYEVCGVKMITQKSGVIPKIQRQIRFYRDFNKCYKQIEKDSIVLLQHPFHYPQLNREKILKKLKEKKNVKFISVIHDVEVLRGFIYNDYYKGEFEFMMNITDVIIVHNEKMKEYFLEIGFDEEKIVVLEIFDYLSDVKKEAVPRFEKSITVAGNLDPVKCGYVGELSRLKKTKVNLYGPNFSEKMKDLENIEYKGIFPPGEIPAKLTEGFGLVWDGTSIDGCQGQSGQYLRYNNPHKLSLYLSSGLPVVIWKDAAEAEFVRKRGVGICVDSVMDLEEIFESFTEEDYNMMVERVKAVSKELLSGKYAREAILRAEKKVGK